CVALATETADLVAAELGESLVVAARNESDPAERARVHRLAVQRASEDAFDGLRFRLEDDLGAAVLGADERRALADLAAPSNSFAKRSFALSVLAASATLSGGDALPATRTL